MNSKIAKERISYVARPDSITTSEGDFLATHVAIKKLKVLEKFDIAPTGGKSFSEEDIFKKYILNPEDRHQFIAIYGQSGIFLLWLIVIWKCLGSHLAENIMKYMRL